MKPESLLSAAKSLDPTLPVLPAAAPVVEYLMDIGGGVTPLAFLPPGWNARELDDIAGRREPRYRQTNLTVHDTHSLADYLARHGTKASAVYLDGANRKITAILDDGEPHTAGRRVDRAVLTVELDPRFCKWSVLCKSPLSQKQFLEFIEDNDSHFSSPSGAQMRSYANGLTVKRNITFQRVEREDSAAADVSLVYKSETQEEQAVSFPQQMTIAVPIFAHQTRAMIPVRIRFDLKDGGLVFMVKIPDEQALIDAAWDEVTASLTDELKEAKVEAPVFRAAAPEPPKS